MRYFLLMTLKKNLLLEEAALAAVSKDARRRSHLTKISCPASGPTVLNPTLSQCLRDGQEPGRLEVGADCRDSVSQ